VLPHARALTSITWWWLGLTLAVAVYSPFIAAGAAAPLLTWLTPVLVWLCSTALLWRFGDSTRRLFSLRLYLGLGVAITLIKTLFRVVFYVPGLTSGPSINLPTVTINLGTWHTTLLGSVPWAVVAAAAIDGLRLAAVVMAFGMANTVANPRRLMKYAPAALYEFWLALAIALSLAPQLVEAASSVRRAMALRGEKFGLAALPKLISPVVEIALTSGLNLAASMEVRGLGVANDLRNSRPWRFARSAGTLVGLCFVAGAIFLLLGTSTSLWIPVALAILGSTLLWLAVTFGVAKRRTRYPVEQPKLGDWVVRTACSAMLVWTALGTLGVVS